MNKKIVIIGAGPSGFAVATKLKANGFQNIELLEAENRFGGRVHTVPFGRNVLDMGAQWCHGEKGNVVHEMAKDKNLLSSNIINYKCFNFIRSNGEVISPDKSDRLCALAMSIINGLEEEKQAYNGSFGNFFAEKYNHELSKDEFSDIDAELKEQAHDFYHRMENSIEASDNWYETSARSLLEYWECEGDQLLNWKDKGYVTVLDLLQNKIPDKNATNVVDIIPLIKLNKEVKKIVYNQPTAIGGPIRVECADGSAYAADHVICTVSLGVLKERHLQMFEPLLPSWKIHTIHGLMYGTVDKLYLEYEAPFWPEGWEGFSLLWKFEQLKIVREDPVNSEWLEGLIGFFPVSFQPNILCGWITGPMARKMEQISHENVKAGIENVLRMFLKKSMPNYSEAKAMIRSKWHSNPHFRGSYTNYSLRSDALGATTSKLAEPIKDRNGQPIVQFAGEATDEHYYSTVHGAIHSGWREAQRLIDLYRPRSQL